MTHGQPGDNTNRKAEKSEGQSDRVEKRAEQKAGSEASHGMEDHNQSIVDGIAKKRQERKSGVTDKFNENLEKGKKVASADELLPLEKSSKKKTEIPNNKKIEAVNEVEVPANRPSEAIAKAMASISAGSLYNGGPPEIPTRYVAAGTPLEIRGKVYPLDEITSQSLDQQPNQASDAAQIPTSRDGFQKGYITNTPEVKEQVNPLEDGDLSVLSKPLEPITDAFSKFTAESTKHVHNMVEDAMVAVGMNPAKDQVRQIGAEGVPMLSSVKSPRDAAHVIAGSVTGFSQAISEMMPGLTPSGALKAASELGTHIVDRALHPPPEAVFKQIKNQLDPIGSFKDDIASLGTKYEQAVSWASERSQKSFSERGQSAGKAGPDVLMAAEGIVFIAKSGEWITPARAAKMGLEKQAPEQLAEQGISKKNVSELKPEDIVNPIDKHASPQEKVRQLQILSAENQPLIEDFKQQIDSKFGVHSYGEPKLPETILEKVERVELKQKKPWFGVEHIRDSQRFTTVVDNLDTLPAIAKDLKESQFQVIDAATSKMEPNERGWRMMPFDMRAPNGQLIEYQVVPTEMYEAGQATHPIHEKWRNVDTSALSAIQKDQLLEDIIKARRICENAWQKYVKRTGQSPEHINAILKQVGMEFEDQSL